MRFQRGGILNSIASSTSTKDVIWIFTDSQSSDRIGSATAQEYADAAKLRGSPFYSIIMDCDIDENLRRLQAVSRGGVGNTKLTDIEILYAIRKTEDIYHFGGSKELVLDVSQMPATEVALKIYTFVDASLFSSIPYRANFGG